MRTAWLILGWCSVGLALLGVALPLLPTVPFLLLAGVAFARSSERAHDWLVRHPRLGPPLADWRERGAIRPGAKRAAMAAILLSFAIPFALGAAAWMTAVQAVALGGVAAFILTRPSA